MITPFDITTPKEIEIEQVSFYSIDSKFSGEGIIHWDMREGFYLKAQVTPNKALKFKGKRSYGGAKALPQKLFRFTLNKIWKAYTITSFSDWNEIPLLLHSGKFSISFSNLIFYSDAVFNEEINIIKGKCFFKLAPGTHLPDLVENQTKLLDEIVFQNTKYEGLYIHDDFIKIHGYINEKELFEVSWEIEKNSISKSSQWDIAIAIRDALSICMGHVATLLRRDIYRNNKSIIEYFKEQEIINLGYFSPLPSQAILDKDLFLTLFKTLLKKDNKSIVIRKLFYQIADSLRVNSFAIWQFMIATSLEAFLRTYYNKPFQLGKKNDTFKNVEFHLFEFKREFFENAYLKEWRNVFKKVNQYYIELRHINAHPDWLNSLNSDNNQKKIDAMRYLSKFYGYVILALAGYKNLKPEIKI